MENASKALIMAGGVLLAIVIITLGVYTFSSLHNLSESKSKEEAQQELVNFNKEYEAYNKRLLRGTEVISALNKANDNNKRYDDDNYSIKISCSLADGSNYEHDNFTTYIKSLETNADKFEEFKRKIFECSSVTYNNKTGRISSMSFKEVQ